MKKKYISKFNPEWIKMKMYRIWLKEVEGNDASAYSGYLRGHKVIKSHTFQ